MVYIEPVQERHLEDLHRAFDAIARERLYYAVTDAGSPADFKQWMATVIARDYPAYVVVAADDGIIGWSIAHQTDQVHMRHSCSIFIGVLPEWRGYGVGSQLLDATLDKAWDKGLTRIELDVYADNVNAINLYRKEGFVEEGVRRHAHIIDGQYRDVITMAIVFSYPQPDSEKLRTGSAVSNVNTVSA